MASLTPGQGLGVPLGLIVVLYLMHVI